VVHRYYIWFTFGLDIILVPLAEGSDNSLQLHCNAMYCPGMVRSRVSQDLGML